MISLPSASPSQRFCRCTAASVKVALTAVRNFRDKPHASAKGSPGTSPPLQKCGIEPAGCNPPPGPKYRLCLFSALDRTTPENRRIFRQVYEGLSSKLRALGKPPRVITFSRLRTGLHHSRRAKKRADRPATLPFHRAAPPGGGSSCLSFTMTRTKGGPKRPRPIYDRSGKRACICVANDFGSKAFRLIQ